MRRILGPLLLSALAIVPASAQTQPARPRLVLVISIDQFRADYLRRFEGLYLPAIDLRGNVGGFRWLMTSGANYTNAHHTHVPTATGPGHASILTGSDPCLNGIVGNDWFDRKTGKQVYCVDDPTVETVGGQSSPMSPRNLFTTTVGDELKMATNGRSKVVGISYKDRAAILMAGHAADTVIWFDGKTLNWVTSTFYAPLKRLPEWVQKINDSKAVTKFAGRSYEPLLPADAYQAARRAPGQKEIEGKVFSHPLREASLAGDLITSGYGQEYLFSTVREGIVAEGLGMDDAPDVLAINLASNDYIGHAYGPNSPEVLDISVRTDRLLSDLFNFLKSRIPGGLDAVTICLTADHGVVPVPEESRDVYHTDAGRARSDAPSRAVQAALTKAYGEGKWVLAAHEPNMYLNEALVEEKKLNLAEVERAAADALTGVPGVYCGFARSQILAGQLPDWDWVKLVYNGFHPRLGGNVIVVDEPGWYNSLGLGTGHGTPWMYDSHVPLIIRGFGVRKGAFARQVGVPDLAPTLSQILGIEFPTGCIGKPLVEALRE